MQSGYENRGGAGISDAVPHHIQVEQEKEESFCRQKLLPVESYCRK